MSDFVKYEALGNDYLIVDPLRTALCLMPGNVKALCDRRQGIGADGVLRGPLFDGDSIRVEIFNADGSECEKSGNGLRIFAHYLREREYVRTDTFCLHTLAGPTRVGIIDFDTGVVSAVLGSFTFDSDDIPLAGPRRKVIDEPLDIEGEVLRIHCINNGNPHCVVFDDDPSRERVSRFGPAISHSPLFPKGTNVQIAKVLDRRNLFVQVWERGAGYTFASGSSACAVASIAHARGFVDAQVSVHMPGGTLTVSISPSGDVCLTGPVRKVAEGTLAPHFRNGLREQ